MNRTMLSDALTHLVNNWKTTVAGFLTITLVTTPVLLTSGKLTVEQAGWALLAQGLAKAWISLIQKDGQGPDSNAATTK